MKNHITLPDGWHEVPIRMFQEMAMLDKSDDGLLKIIDLISILADEDPEIIKNIDASNLELLTERINWTSKFPDTEYKTDFSIGDDTFYLVRFRDLSLGEWIDLDAYSEEPLNNMHKIFAVLYRPYGEKYNTKLCAERAELFLDKLMIGDVYGALFFFSLIAQEYIKISADSLLNQIHLN